MTTCKECLHVAVCARYAATGGRVRECGNFVIDPKETEKITDGAKAFTLEEMAQKICNFLFANNDDACWDGSCPAADYCTKGRNGMASYLREVLKE